MAQAKSQIKKIRQLQKISDYIFTLQSSIFCMMALMQEKTHISNAFQ